MKKTAILFLFLSACAPQIINQNLIVDVEFQEYVDSFEYLTGVRYSGGINFASEGSLSYYQKDAVGVCLYYRNGDREIKVDRGYWSISSAPVKEELIFHELGHCALDRPHENETMTLIKEGRMSVVPQSIMYPYSFGGELYILLKDYYIQELIDPNNALTELSL